MTSIPVTNANFHQEADKYNLPIVAYFWTEWCGPCKQLGPILEQLSDEMSEEIKVFKINVDQNPESANVLGVRNLPSIFIFDRNGKVIANRSGSASKQELKSWIQDSI